MRTVTDIIREAMMAEVERIVGEEAKEAGIRVEKRVKEMAVQVGIKVMERFQMEMVGDRALKIVVDFGAVKKGDYGSV